MNCDRIFTGNDIRYFDEPRTVRAARAVSLSAAALGMLAGTAEAQTVRFSIDYRGPTIGKPDFTVAAPITEADILSPSTPGGVPAFGPLPVPTIVISGGFGPPAPGLGLALHPGCMGHPPATPCGIEVDALSFGVDQIIRNRPQPAGTYVFSVDECSPGIAGVPLPPNVGSETPVGDSAADVFEDLGLPAAPVPPIVIPTGNTGIIDGNGLVSASGFVYPGLGIVEPTFAGAIVSGDDVDALDIVGPGPTPAPIFGVFFSLDSTFINPCLGIPNTGSAAAHGFLPGAVLVTVAPGGPPAVYAPPAALGLDFFGPGRDDLDALALVENGIPGYQPSAVPYDWVPVGPVFTTDMLLFSVRRGSAVIGMPDSNFGIPIEPGDILTTPRAGGLSPFPGIFIAAENLGLMTTRTSGVALAADLDALDTRQFPETGVGYCFGDGSGAACPCLNFGAPGHGCANSVFAAGGLLGGTGLASVSADSVVLNGSSMPSSSCAYFQGTAQTAIPFYDGIVCVGGAIIRLGTKFNTLAGTSFYPDLAAGDLPVSVRGAIPLPGATRFYQVFYRNAAPVFCPPGTANYTNGFAIVWTP